MRARIQLDITKLEDTVRIGKSLGQLVQPGDVVALIGDLGAGKTTLAQAIAEGAQVEEPVSSPTFSLIKEYNGRIPVYHMDIYRLGVSAQLEDLGWEEYFYGDGVCLVEWAEMLMLLLPADTLYVKLEQLGTGQRLLEAYGTGARSNTLVKEWEALCRI